MATRNGAIDALPTGADDCAPALGVATKQNTVSPRKKARGTEFLPNFPIHANTGLKLCANGDQEAICTSSGLFSTRGPPGRQREGWIARRLRRLTSEPMATEVSTKWPTLTGPTTFSVRIQ
jgi:hypothetical protein